jgi:hypothetical protein
MVMGILRDVRWVQPPSDSPGDFLRDREGKSGRPPSGSARIGRRGAHRSRYTRSSKPAQGQLDRAGRITRGQTTKNGRVRADALAVGHWPRKKSKANDQPRVIRHRACFGGERELGRRRCPRDSIDGHQPTSERQRAIDVYCASHKQGKVIETCPGGKGRLQRESAQTALLRLDQATLNQADRVRASVATGKNDPCVLDEPLAQSLASRVETASLEWEPMTSHPIHGPSVLRPPGSLQRTGQSKAERGRTVVGRLCPSRP